MVGLPQLDGAVKATSGPSQFAASVSPAPAKIPTAVSVDKDKPITDFRFMGVLSFFSASASKKDDAWLMERRALAARGAGFIARCRRAPRRPPRSARPSRG